LNTINFLLAVHNHQPVGNFDFVIEDAYRAAYLPFLEVLERHPAIRVGLHNSGCLIDWLLVHHPEYLDRLGTLVERGQIEMLSGGYYEPILSSIPDADREGQVRKLSDWLARRFGRRPTGVWLAERVWEPSMVGALARAGARYTMVDDSHFIAAGLERDRLWGHYVTEDQGSPLHVYPISKDLRYLIPFRPPEETITFLRGLAEDHPDRTALLGDDGEKFGVWPETHKLVYEEGWLDRFFTLLEENQEWIRLRFPGEVVSAVPPEGKVYLPTASYEEMMEWAMPPDAQRHFHTFHHRVNEENHDNVRFVRGGFWRNFFARYPESDHINKRMLQVRGRAEKLDGRKRTVREEAMDLVWASQCNCAYWHGVFGGLYLPHLREALYERILAAETLVDAARHGEGGWVAVERADFDCDGDREVFLRNPDLTLVVSPGEGGALQEIGVKPLRVALGNGLTRRPEAYHEKVTQAVAPSPDSGNGTKSIHDLVLAKEAGLERYLHYDRYRRCSLVDHFLRSDSTVESFHSGEFGEQGDFSVRSYETATAEQNGFRVVSLRRTGTVWKDGEAHRVAVEKRLRLGARGALLDVDYLLENVGETSADLWFGVEWNLAMMAGNSPDHFYRIPGVPEAESALGSMGTVEATETVALVDRHRGFEVRLELSRPGTLWRAPVETVSLSEGGFERIYQSSALLPNWRVRLGPRERWNASFRLEVNRL
jgi:hypothetical protein